MGACQAGGTVIDWVMHAEGVSFRHAVELLQADYLPLAASSVMPPAGLPAKHSTVKKLPTALERDASDASVDMTVQLWIVRWAITRGQIGYDLRSFVTGMMECKDDDPCHDPKVEHIVFKRDFTPWKRTVVREVNERELEYLSKWGETKVPIFLGE
jgi:hypothetical protein